MRSVLLYMYNVPSSLRDSASTSQSWKQSGWSRQARVKAAEQRARNRVFPFVLRRMRASDRAQCEEIERESFPTLFPPTSFRRELDNRRASYQVAFRPYAEGAAAESPEARRPPLAEAFLRSARGLLRGEERDFIAGFAGAWDMAGSAHIVNICVRGSHRGQGVGELLLLGAIEDAVARGAAEVTLEVRPSNVVARNLYRKYGFTDRGVRKAYYSDNREDAVIMTTDPIQESPFAARFAELDRRHRERWGRRQ